MMYAYRHNLSKDRIKEDRLKTRSSLPFFMEEVRAIELARLKEPGWEGNAQCYILMVCMVSMSHCYPLKALAPRSCVDCWDGRLAVYVDRSVGDARAENCAAKSDRPRFIQVSGVCHSPISQSERA